MEQNNSKLIEGKTPFEIALEEVANTNADQALKIEKAILEGRLTIQDVIGFANTKRVVQ